ncbi:rod shape-determining protein MreC [Planomonospora venezuelensis]|uniref:Cell shape-determining protein MreC n=1 Tax=Planomonospora venezuelensis TaxID=1999 RepID=A0A841DBS3_PLAVE|nr:rod shape-determining protein MreC [Planomonospora venezuelensis]MBB5966939.1 rod shape-determining protein MreC [Planomonospora venezuelensis]GIN02441.1 rod shape-determining protein MreC [Planomonospora venezuelensis]
MKDTRRTRAITGLLLAMALVLMTVDHRTGEGSPLGPLKGMGAAVFGGVEQLGAEVARPVGRFLDALLDAPGAQERVEELRRENDRLRRDLMAQNLDRRRSEELHRLLGAAGTGGYRIVPAQVVARRGVPGFEEAVELDAGESDGVRPEMTVLSGAGLVGRVIRVGPATSTVVLVSDLALATGARLEGSGEIGFVNGTGDHGRLLQFRLLDSTAPLEAGQRIVSFGSHRGAPYVAGVPIGVIERVEATPGELTRTAYARPYADLTALDVVGVVVEPPERDPRDALLPPRPAKASGPAKTAGPSEASDPAKAAGAPGTTSPRERRPRRERRRPRKREETE